MDTSKLISLLNVTALVAIMLSMGLRVRFADLLASARLARLLALSLLANYVLVPLATVALLYLFQADPMVAAGFLVLAACPGAPVGPPITGLVRGDVTWAIGVMLILAALSAVLTPVLLGLMLTRLLPGNELHIDFFVIVKTLLVTQLLPLMVGLGIHSGSPRVSQALARPLALLANVLLIVVVGLIIASQYETLAAIRTRGWAGMGLLLLASLGVGWLCGGPSIATRKALAVTTTTRNIAVGLVIVNSNFAGTPAVTAVVAYGLLSIFGALVFAVVLRRFAASEPGHAPAGS